jgi:hypothetical protein
MARRVQSPGMLESVSHGRIDGVAGQTSRCMRTSPLQPPAYRHPAGYAQKFNDVRVLAAVRRRGNASSRTARGNRMHVRGRRSAVDADLARQHSGQCSQHRPIRPREQRSSNPPPQQRHLMTQHQQLSGQHGITTGEHRQPSERPNHDQIQKSNTHDRRSCPINAPTPMSHLHRRSARAIDILILAGQELASPHR